MVSKRDAGLRHALVYLAALIEAEDVYLRNQKNGLAKLDNEWANIRKSHTWAAQNIQTDQDALLLCSAFPAFRVLALRLENGDNAAWLRDSLTALQYIHQYATDKGIANLGDDELLKRWLNIIVHDIEDYSQISKGRQHYLRNDETFVQHGLFSKVSNWVARWLRYLFPAQVIPPELLKLDFVRYIESNRWSSLGEAYRYQGDLEHAMECQQKAAEIVREVVGESSEWLHSMNMGNTYADMGRFAEAGKSYEFALRFVPTPGERMRLLNNLGTVYKNLGKYDQARKYHEQALRLAQALGDKEIEGTCWGNLGEVSRYMKQTDKAIEYQQHALIISTELGDDLSKGKQLGNLGTAYWQAGQIKEAIQCYEEAVEIARKVGDRRGEGNRLGNMGKCYAILEEYNKAISLHKQSIAIAREVGNKLGEANDTRTLAEVYARQSQYERALELWEQARRMYDEMGLIHLVKEVDELMIMTSGFLNQQ